MINGSCLCGKVTYKIDGKISRLIHCHCYKCRKAHASAFSSVASVLAEDFHLEGKNWLSSFESSPGKHRHFCSQCGSQIFAQRDNNKNVVLRLGCVDSDIASQEMAHTWVSEKAQWYTIDKKLPQFEGGLHQIVPLSAKHLDATHTLLNECQLSPDDLNENLLNNFVGIFVKNKLVAMGGMETSDHLALLRSIACLPKLRGQGLAKGLIRQLETSALDLGITDMYLLTDTAENYFLKRGYQPIPRGDAPMSITTTQQFSNLCPTSATLMIKKLSHPPN